MGIDGRMLIDGPAPESIEEAGLGECYISRLPLTPNMHDIVLFVWSGEGITDVMTERGSSD